MLSDRIEEKNASARSLKTWEDDSKKSTRRDPKAEHTQKPQEVSECPLPNVFQPVRRYVLGVKEGEHCSSSRKERCGLLICVPYVFPYIVVNLLSEFCVVCGRGCCRLAGDLVFNAGLARF